MGLDRSYSCSTIVHTVGVLSLSHGYRLYEYTYIYNIYLFIVRQSPLESGVSSLTSWQKQKKQEEEFKAKSGGGISFIFSFFSVGIRIAA